MRKVVAGFAISLDGYIEGPGGEYEWMTKTIDPDYDFAESASRFDTFIYGRKSYEKLKGFDASAFAGKDNYVLSRSLTHVQQPFILSQYAAKDLIGTLRHHEGKDIALYGGAELLTSFLNEGLVDEISMTFVPVFLGAGKPAVGMLNQLKWLELKAVKQFQLGNVQITYGVKKD